MLRKFSLKWLGIPALVLSPAVALCQATPQSHTVRPGDTLWDLAKQYRGDPFLWPDLYRMNTAVVEDPHWIYPGEVLRLSGTETLGAVPATDTPEPPPSSELQSPDSGAAPAAPAPALAPATPAPADQRSLAELTRSAVGEGDESEPLFGPRPANTLRETLSAYTKNEYQPLRRSEFYASGFLTENKKLPWAKIVGPVTPSQIGSPITNDALPFVTIAIEAPHGASYQIGDTLLLVTRGREIGSLGEVVLPTGLARVTDTASGRYLASVEAVFGPIRAGQLALPAEKFTPAGPVHAVPVSDGVRGTLLGGPKRQELKAPQMVVFIDKGRADGVAPGDIFEARRTARRLDNGRQLSNELLATMQIVHVREHSATARLFSIVLPDIAPGTGVRQVAKLPS
jgi:LysM domain-containing protein